MAVVVPLVSCANAAPDGAPPPSRAPATRDALAGFDICHVLTPEQSAELGIEGPGRRFDVYPETGCEFDAERIALGLAQNSQDDGLGFYRQNASQYAEFEENQVAGRQGAQLVIHEEGCHQVVAAGSGNVVVQVLVHVRYEDTVDPCVEAYRIAEMIEPRLPPVED